MPYKIKEFTVVRKSSKTGKPLIYKDKICKMCEMLFKVFSPRQDHCVECGKENYRIRVNSTARANREKKKLENPELLLALEKIKRDKVRQTYKPKRYPPPPGYAKKLRNSSPQRLLNYRMQTAIRNSLFNGKGGKSWCELVGYTKEEFKNHIQSLFKDGMNWENIKEWHIDHIIPKSSFKYETPRDQEFLDCWALSNLRPLWAIDNIKKGDYLPCGKRARHVL